MELLGDILFLFLFEVVTKNYGGRLVSIKEECAYLDTRSGVPCQSHCDCAKLDKMTIVGILLIYSCLSY